MSNAFVARVKVLAVVVVAMLVLLGCSEDEVDPQGETPTATSTAVVASPTATARPALTVTPAGRRTGIPAVDAVIVAAEARDGVALTALARYYPMPCTPGQGAGAIPCPPGSPAGTPVTVWGYSQCEGGFLRPGDPAVQRMVTMFVSPPPQSLPFDPAVYAVLRSKPIPTEPIPGEALVVFASGHVAAVDAEGHTFLIWPCGTTAAEWVTAFRQRFGSPPFILAPQ